MKAAIVLPGQPKTKKNSQKIIVNQRTGRPQVVQSAHYRQYEKNCLEYLRFTYRGPRFEGPIRVTARYYLENGHRPDLINLLQATCDILEKAHVIANDRDIMSLDGSKIAGVDRKNPRVEIEIEEV